ncbi:SDR family NAD(P)-dependent oxidoreductase [Streptomyces sp. DSM 44917]|uniref:SDR family NAD(P)-dependent oxidoreductase n=1 Tax=Streptomyces boetiae TaxID=3075541 RepID=A0ABU2L241_9ACTN|nr:SDR family NAD(P)-dependent oxidoreductase [Streptomyces sp. DSM 44917]MDT0305486.1 SDR family NAD(P)-dependent oxidoreductase [Streptomyces sp. DSM 44917]
MRTILITGSTDGLGRYLALRLAEAGERVIVHGRSAERAGEVVAEIREATGAEDRAEAVLADLSSLREADRLADEVLARHGRLDALVNNAGLGAGPPGAGREESPDGIELRFAVNYLAGYRLVSRLRGLLEETGTPEAPARIVNVASAGQQPVDYADPMLERSYDGRRAYSQSKLAQIMHAFDLAAELPPQVLANALHPATYMDTTMVREWGVSPWNTVETGGRATLRLISGENVGTGQYFDGERPTRAREEAYDADARRRLRDLSDTLIAKALG